VAYQHRNAAFIKRSGKGFKRNISGIEKRLKLPVLANTGLRKKIKKYGSN
jgi:hypothetical protein